MERWLKVGKNGSYLHHLSDSEVGHLAMPEKSGYLGKFWEQLEMLGTSWDDPGFAMGSVFMGICWGFTSDWIATYRKYRDS